MKLPGYRSKTPWKMALATLIYGVIIFYISFGIFNSDSSYYVPGTEDSSENTVEGTANSNPDIKTGANESGAETGDYNSDISESVKSGMLSVHFIDVGQADSILVITPEKKVMLVDAGNNNDGDTVSDYIRNQGINRIDVVVGTHPHEDHIGGLDTVIENFDIGKVYLPKAVSATKTFEDVLAAVKEKGLKVSTAAGGVGIDIDPQVKSIFLAPNSGGYESMNNYSAVIKLVYGRTSFLLTGDAEDISEDEMIRKGYDLKADVLKAGHHGSSSSTTPDFLSMVDPEYAVIMVGKDNEYGHPHRETMDRLKDRGINVYRTDENGTVIAESDGKSIKFNK